MVDYTKIKNLEGLKNTGKQTTQKPIPHTKATLLHEDNTVKHTIINQSDMTSDCWLIQFEGFDACVNCEYFLKRDCGGGKTLAKMIIEAFSESMMTKIECTKYFFNIDKDYNITSEKPNAHFYGWMKYAKEHYVFTYSLKKYKRKIEEIKQVNEDRSKHEDYVPLDVLYPYEETSKTGKRIAHSGYHQSFQCECVNTTSKGSYKDETYEYEGKTIYYYHQHAILVKEGKHYTLDSCGYRTVTTKERINGYLPNGFRLYSVKYKWYVRNMLNKKEWDFFDGMVLTA